MTDFHIHKILVVENDTEFGQSVKLLLEKEGFDVVHVRKVAAAIEKLLSEHFDLVVSDLALSGQTGLDLLRKIRSEKLGCPTIIMTSYTSIKCAAQALRLGAADYILKPFTDSYIVHAVTRAINEKCIKKENQILRRDLRDALHSEREMIGNCQSITELKAMITRVGPCEAKVLIQGESGTGKELVAQAIHKESARRDGRFVAVNCGAIPMELMEAEFFGHIKGAFTGAVAESEGLFRRANGGTLFLDEIAELAPALQVKLLRVLEDRSIRPVGSSKSYNVDIRIIAASNRDLQKEVAQGKMREDLFYRLNVIQILVPPLRQRGGDLELLLYYFIKIYSAKLGRKINKISDEALVLLKEYDWPGNIRELENSVERAVILAKGEILGIEDFKHIKANSDQDYLGSSIEMDDRGPMSIEEYTKSVVQNYQSNYNEIQLAKLLGIGRKALWIRRNRWGLHRDNHVEPSYLENPV